MSFSTLPGAKMPRKSSMPDTIGIESMIAWITPITVKITFIDLSFSVVPKAEHVTVKWCLAAPANTALGTLRVSTKCAPALPRLKDEAYFNDRSTNQESDNTQ